MANFVFGGEPLNNGKSNFQVSPAPANQSINDTDWNLLYTHLSDTREAISDNAYYFGLAQSSSAVSGANKARFRLNSSNSPQISVNGGAYDRFTNVGIHVSDYGAVGDGVTNDATAIQAAIDASASLKRPLYFDAKIYLVNTELKVLTQGCLIGTKYVNGSCTTLKAGAAIRSVLRIGADSGAEGAANVECNMSGIVFDADELATYCVFGLGWSNSHTEFCRFGNALRDGIFLADRKTDGTTVAISDHNSFSNNHFGTNGSFYGTTEFDDPNELDLDLRTLWYAQSRPFTLSATTAATTSAGSNVTIAGATFQTWGIRRGDQIRIGTGANRQQYVVSSVTSETVLVIRGTASLTRAADPWVICTGAGYFEDGHTDNNINKLYSNIFTSNVGGAMAFSGIYGPTVIGNYIQYSPLWGITVGNRTSAVINSYFASNYFEALGRKPFYFLFCLGVNCVSSSGEGSNSDPYDILPTAVRGTYLTDDRNYVLDFTVAQQEDNSGLSSMRSYLPARSAYDARIFGKTRHFGTQYNEGTNWTPTGGGAAAIDPMNEVVALAASAAPITVVATPTFTVTNERIIYVYNRGSFDITLQDEGTLAGSKLKLAGTANVVLTPGSTLTLLCADSYWHELSRSLR